MLVQRTGISLRRQQSLALALVGRSNMQAIRLTLAMVLRADRASRRIWAALCLSEPGRLSTAHKPVRKRTRTHCLFQPVPPSASDSVSEAAPRLCEVALELASDTSESLRGLGARFCGEPPEKALMTPKDSWLEPGAAAGIRPRAAGDGLTNPDVSSAP